MRQLQEGPQKDDAIGPPTPVSFPHGGPVKPVSPTRIPGCSLLRLLPGFPGTHMSSQFQTLLVSGRDRVRFLHNFCTADIRGLTTGHALEAFFPDARGRILAHGYVLMLEDQLQVWLLADDPQRLQKHLDRYIISEDVVLSQAVSSASGVFDAAGMESLPGLPVVAPGRCGVFADQHGRAAGLCVSWAGQPIGIYCGAAATVASLREAAELQTRLLSDTALERLRITERFPIIGVDVSIDHLAPEADRNAQAICYSKGCYLGQEPIARIDAIGHVNRALRKVRLTGLAGASSPIDGDGGAVVAGAELLLTDGAVAGTVTSAGVVGEEAWGLSVLRLASLGQINLARLADGTVVPATVQET